MKFATTLFVLSAVAGTLALPSMPGTCEVEKMSTGQHPAPLKPGSTGGMTISAAAGTAKNTWTVTVAGTGQYKGILLYAVDASGTHVGAFSGQPAGHGPRANCPSGAAAATLGHTSGTPKNFPLTVTWTGDKTGVTFKSLVVKSFNDWYTLAPFGGNGTATSGTSASSTPTSSASSSSGVIVRGSAAALAFAAVIFSMF